MRIQIYRWSMLKKKKKEINQIERLVEVTLYELLLVCTLNLEKVHVQFAVKVKECKNTRISVTFVFLKNFISFLCVDSTASEFNSRKESRLFNIPVLRFVAPFRFEKNFASEMV